MRPSWPRRADQTSPPYSVGIDFGTSPDSTAMDPRTCLLSSDFRPVRRGRGFLRLLATYAGYASEFRNTMTSPTP
eukprot:8446007-Pyramimonas_sp.AAC.1